MEKAVRPRIHTFVATSDIHLESKLHKSREEALEMAFQVAEMLATRQSERAGRIIDCNDQRTGRITVFEPAMVGAVNLDQLPIAFAP